MKKHSLIKQIFAGFFSTSQMGATIICGGFFQSSYNPNPILVFCTLPAIQTSAFGMTLMRKNLITKTTWQVVYSLELVLVYILWFLEYGNIKVISFSLIAYLLRKQNISKYIIWLGFYLLHDYYLDRNVFALLKNNIDMTTFGKLNKMFY